MYQSFAPDMPYQEMLKNYEEARSVFREFSSNEGHYKTDVAKTLEYMEENYHVQADPVFYFCKRKFKLQLSVQDF